jgi:hypothetical protein
MTNVSSAGTMRAYRARTPEALSYIVTIVLMLSPFLICFGLLELIAWTVGETWSMQHVANWQGGNPDRMWRGGDGRSYLTYKVARVHQLEPEVIMLGQSRANFVVSSMFKPYSFYNSLLTAWTFSQYLRFLEIITTHNYSPKVLFFNLDYWMFNDKFDHAWTDRFYEQPATHWEDLKLITDELIREPELFLVRVLYAKNEKGIFAVRNGDGFRADGSLKPQPPKADPQRLVNDGINVGNPPAVVGDKLDAGPMADFERFAAFARSKNIKLVGVQMPYYAKVVDSLNGNPWALLWDQFQDGTIKPYLDNNGVLFFNFADMPEYRNRPEDFVDSVHPAEPVVRDVMHRVLSDPRVRAILPDLASN